MAIRRCTLRSALPVLVLASALALSACSGGADAESQRPPTGPASASATATPTPAADSRPTPASSTGPARNLPRPQLPAAAKENTKAGFEAFTQYWFDTVTYALETGDTGPLKAVSKPDCKICVSYIKSGETAKADGGWRVGPQWTISDFVTDMRLDPLGQAVAYFSMEESASQVIGPDRKISRSRAGGKLKTAQALYAKFENGAWLTSEAGTA
ncbi:DUF6318 family protein [Sinomonas atrocyanea]|uniref:DUF6318 family protein n=1 Tax=Sinomonas atrocyanea TaxID=37927 RepID=UPI002789C4F2|nr:DUF6318 family protein [Sinomonas atrocyanea]MDQ0259436.1 hypothetical protein [Sinomonas atrocyanea]MDR6621159.1 hypothetical protein [Sinomonas atrocyanea]